MSYTLHEVTWANAALKRAFLELPVRLYRGNPYWIRPLDQDMEAVFDPAKNKTFKHGECIRWVLKNISGEVVGRVAAFYDKRLFAKEPQPTGGMGFFECIDDQAAANVLLQACKDWLMGHGVEAMDGPINFGGRDRWWGLLLDGEAEPNFGMFYHHKYYRALLENFGFRLYYEQYTYGRKVQGPLTPRLLEKAERILDNPDYEFRMLEKDKLDQYTEYFRQVYNQAWVSHSGVGEMSSLQAKTTMKALKPILDPRLLWFGFYKGEPVAFFIMIPDLNQLYKYLNGNFNWWGKLQFLYHRWRGHCQKAIGIAFGVVPAHQGKGVESALVAATARVVQKRFPYQDFELTWVGSFNPKMLKVTQLVNTQLTKTHGTFRLLFDPEAEWKEVAVIK